MFRRSLWMLVPALLLAACGQQAQPTASQPLSEDVPWSYTAPDGALDASFGALSLDPGNNPLRAEPLLSATNGYGPFEINRSNGEAAKGDGHPITLNGAVYATGFGVHSDGTLVYSLQNTVGATCSIFQAKIGVDDEVGDKGSVVFQVLTGATPDTATVAYDSGVMTGASATKTINLNISGSKVLLLRVTDAGDGNYYDHADWARPTIACATAPAPAPGSLDTGFDGSGFGVDPVNVPVVPSFTALQPNGKIIGFGKQSYAGLGYFLRRLDQDGHLDTTFTALFIAPEADKALGLVAYPDGRILILGYGYLPKPDADFGSQFYFVQRFLPNGAADPSFGNGIIGYIGARLLNESAGITSLALQPDGKILLGGDVFVRRLLSNGQDDPSFGTAGRVDVPTSVFSSTNPQDVVTIDTVKNLSVQPDGKILVLGGTTKNGIGGSYSVVKRLLPSGAVDTAFGNAGTAAVTYGRLIPNYAWAARTLSNGNILIAAQLGTSFSTSCILAQFTSTGQTDSAFTQTPEGFASPIPDSPISLAIQSDGKAILGGCRAGPVRFNDKPALFRFNTDGMQDKTFGTVFTPYDNIGAPVPDSRNVLIQPAKVGGKIISGLNPLSRVWP